MRNTLITTTMIETAINKGIRDIKDNPKRGIRNLVDLANHFANSPFQKNILELMQTMLSNLNSPYYRIVSYLVNNVDNNILKTFGINIAYYSWTNGAKIIRKSEENLECCIPWTIVFDLKEKERKEYLNLNINHIIKQGKELGIYTYMFFSHSIDDLECFIKDNPDCAFILFISPHMIEEESISKMKSYRNIFFSILYEGSNDTIKFKNIINLLHANNSLFGVYSFYGDENREDILSNKWVNDVININSPFGILIESKNCSKETALLVHEYIFNSKTNQKHSAFLVDLWEDIARIKRYISTDSCKLDIEENSNSCLFKFDSSLNPNIDKQPLYEVFLKHKGREN